MNIKGGYSPFGANSLEGPKWCEKTWAALNHANSAAFIMDPTDNHNNKTLAKLNPAPVLSGETPRLHSFYREMVRQRG